MAMVAFGRAWAPPKRALALALLCGADFLVQPKPFGKRFEKMALVVVL
jgi:hypothetical protein